MNVYDQLHAIREELERRNASPETLAVVDKFIAQAEPERDNPLAISEPMMVRHLLRQRAVLNNETIRMDFEALAGDIDERRPTRRDEDLPDATAEGDRGPQRLHSFYKRQKEKDRQQRR